MNVVERLLKAQPFRYIKSGTIRFSQDTGGPVSWHELREKAHFTAQHDPLADEMDSLLHGAVRDLFIMFGTVIMLLYPALILLVILPLRSIWRTSTASAGETGSRHWNGWRVCCRSREQK